MPLLGNLSPGYAELRDVIAILVVLLGVAICARGVFRVVLVVQVIYWTLSFVARPAVLLAVKPAPTTADNVADPRLAYAGYDYTLSHVLHPIVIGLCIYTACALIFVLLQRARPRPSAELMTATPVMVTTLVVLWGLGLVGRVAAYASGTAGSAGEVATPDPYLALVTFLGTLGAVGLILLYHSDRFTVVLAVIGIAAGSELVWGIIEQSKTPFLGAVLAIAIRVVMAGITITRVVALVVGAFVVIGLFGWLQSFKTTTTTDIATNADAAYPTSVRPFLSILRRFDLLEAATDTYYYHGPGYIDLTTMFTRMFTNLIPSQLGVPKVASGVAWAQEVRGSSVDMSTISVSLAEGHLNEGYQIAGYEGIIIESILVLIFAAAVSWSLRARWIPVVILGLSFVALPPLFERGVVGISEVLGKSLQQAIIAGIIAAIVAGGYRLRDRKRSLATVSPLQEGTNLSHV